jgi:hypothetical protein
VLDCNSRDPRSHLPRRGRRSDPLAPDPQDQPLTAEGLSGQAVSRREFVAGVAAFTGGAVMGLPADFGPVAFEARGMGRTKNVERSAGKS